MKEWKKVKIGEFISNVNTRYYESDEQKNLEVFGVSNKHGIIKTDHKKSSDLSKYIVVNSRCLAYNPYRINVGSVGMLSGSVNGLVSPAYVVFKTNEEKLLPELLLSFLKSRDGLFEIKKNARGTVRQTLGYESLCNIEMIIPPIDIQREIVKKRVKLDRFNDKLKIKFSDQKTMLQKLRQSILQDAINSTDKLVSLDEICDLTKGESPIQKTDPGRYPLVVTGEARKSSNEFQFNTKAVCVPLVSSTGHGKKSLNYVHYQQGKFALGNILVALIPKDENILNAKFLHQYLLINKEAILVSLMRGMANVTLPIKDLKKLIIPLPNINDQKKVESLMQKLDKLEAEISQNQKTADMLIQAVLKEAFEK